MLGNMRAYWVFINNVWENIEFIGMREVSGKKSLHLAMKFLHPSLFLWIEAEDTNYLNEVIFTVFFIGLKQEIPNPTWLYMELKDKNSIRWKVTL